MNKKFSTLVASVLLAGAVGTVNAQTYAAPSAATLATKIVEGKYYQLGVTNGGVTTATATNVLTMQEVSGQPGKYELVVKTLVGGTAQLPNTLWKVAVKQNSEGALSYQFINVATNMPLSLNSALAAKPASTTGAITAFPVPSGDALAVGGDVNTWKWQPAITSVGAYKSMEMYSAFGAKLDSAVTLVAAAAINNDVKVGAAKYALGNQPTSADVNQVFLAPFEAGSVILTVDDLNSMLWTQKYNAAASKVKFTFDKDVENNVKTNFFTSQSYKAVPAVGFPAETPTAAAPGTAVANADVAALKTAEINLFDGKADEALAKAISSIIDVDYAGNKADVTAAIAGIEGIVAAGLSSVVDKAGLVAAVNGVTNASPTLAYKTLAKVQEAVNAFVNTKSDQVSNEATAQALLNEAVKSTATTGIAYNIASAATTEAMAIAVKVYTDAITTPNTGLQAVYDAAYATAKATFATNANAAGAKWVSLQANDETDVTKIKYLAVDTNFVTTQAGNKHLSFALKTFKDVAATNNGGLLADDVTRMDLNGRYNFQFQYFPSSDSIVIRTAGFAKKQESTPYWTMMTTTTNPADLGIDKAAATGIPTAGTLPAEQNLIKIAVLADNHRELTVGSSEFKAGATPLSTINTRIYIGRTTSDDRTTLASGLYFLNLKSGLATRASENNGYKVAKLTANQYGNTSAAVRYTIEDESQLLGTIQNFYNMPATQWVVEQGVGETGKELVSIYNREYPSIKVENIQLYKDANGNIAMPFAAGNYFSAADTLAFGIIKPTDSETYTNEYLGYAQIDSTILDEKIFKFDYLSGIQMGNYVNVLDSKTDSVLRVDLKGANTMFVLETAPVKAEGYFGYAGKLALGKDRMFQHLRRTAYVLKVQDGDKLIQNNKYVKMVSTTSTGEPLYVVADIKKADAAQFFLKENNEVTAEKKATPYYALVGAEVIANDTLYQETADRVGVKDGSLLLSNERYNETRVAAFALTEDNSPLYRRLGVSDPKDGLKDMTTDTAKIYRINATAREYLYEDAYSVYSKEKGINFLGVEGKGDAKAASLFVDTAYVRNETNMPQYMFAVGVTVVPEGMMCPENPEHNTPEYIANHGDCGHKVQTKGYVYGRYLINAQDSVVSAPNGKDYIWNEKYTRLAFVPAKHIEDTLVIYRNGKPSLAPEDSIFLGNNAHNKVTEERPNGIKNPVFALRLINDEPQCDFLIESAGNHKIPTENTGKWIAIKNGVPVVASYLTYKDAILDAEHFNIEKTAETPTANEGISTSEVSVIAGNGTVTIKGAQGKTVVIANVLGQTIANTVLSSDKAEIAAPAGVVVVAVEGEAAVKAIVK